MDHKNPSAVDRMTIAVKKRDHLSQCQETCSILARRVEPCGWCFELMLMVAYSEVDRGANMLQMPRYSSKDCLAKQLRKAL